MFKPATIALNVRQSKPEKPMSEKSEPQAPAKPVWTKPRLELIVNLSDAEAHKTFTDVSELTAGAPGDQAHAGPAS